MSALATGAHVQVTAEDRAGTRVLLGVSLMAVTGLGFIVGGVLTTDPTDAEDTTTTVGCDRGRSALFPPPEDESSRSRDRSLLPT